MFGYVKTDEPELKVKDQRLYRGYYCGLCKVMRAEYGIGARFMLNYDCTFAAILADALIEHEDTYEPCYMGRCDFRPLRRKYPIVKSCSALEFAATLNVLLTYYKLKDDWNDERKVLAGGGIVMFKAAASKAAERSEKMRTSIETGLTNLSVLEHDNCRDVDLPANAFGELLSGAICAMVDFITVSDATLEILRILSYNLGKWIYYTDAWCDMKKDLSEKTYNPFIAAETPKSVADMLMALALREVIAAFDLLDITANRAILSNILFDGCYLQSERILNAST